MFFRQYHKDGNIDKQKIDGQIGQIEKIYGIEASIHRNIEDRQINKQLSILNDQKGLLFIIEMSKMQHNFAITISCEAEQRQDWCYDLEAFALSKCFRASAISKCKPE